MFGEFRRFSMYLYMSELEFSYFFSSFGCFSFIRKITLLFFASALCLFILRAIILGWQFGILDRPESSIKYSSKLFKKHLALQFGACKYHNPADNAALM